MNYLLPLMKILGPDISGVLLLILQFICLYLDVHSSFVFGSLWCVFALYAYTVYFGDWMINKVYDFIDMIAAHFRVAVMDSAKIIRDELQETGTTLATGTTMSGLITNFSKHKIGITLCAKSAITATTPVQVVEETVKVSSMLGLEHSVINAALGKLSSIGSEALTQALGLPVEQHGIEEIESFIPMVATVAGLADQEFSNFELNGKMEKISKNIRSAETIMAQVRKCAETAGIVKPKNFALLEELSTLVADLRVDYEWIVQLLALQGSEFLKPLNYDRVKSFKAKVNTARARFKSIDIPAIRNNQIITECNSVLSKANDYLNQIEVIRANSGTRVCPVGICIQGESHIGKSTLVPILCARVKAKLGENRELVGDASQWSRWDANQREEFDSGYVGQEIVYMDDAFQDKTNKDHLMWYTWISNIGVGTIQGVAEQKGLPFRGLMCITTCNDFPRTSIAVNTIGALHNRFPVTVRVAKVGSKPERLDPTFAHMKFTLSTMTDAIHGGPSRDVTLDELATIIADRVVKEHIKFQDNVEALRLTPLVQHADDDAFDDFMKSIEEIPDDIEAILEEEELEEPGPSSRIINNPVIEEEDELVRAVLSDDYTRLPYMNHLGTIPNDTDWSKLADDIIRSLQTVINSEGFHSIEHVGKWTDYIERYENGQYYEFDPSDYMIENGLYTFLCSLGKWQVKADLRADFEEEFKKQPPLSVCGAFQDKYTWSPFLGKGSALILIDEDTKIMINEKLVPWWRRNKTHKIKAKLFCIKMLESEFLTTYFRSLAVIPTYTLTGLSLLHCAHVLSMYGAWMGRIPFIWTNSSPYRANRSWLRNVGYSALMVPVWPQIALSRVFDYLDSIVQRLTSGLRSIVLRCMEYLGLDVTRLWEDVADLTVSLISDSLTAILASVLVYLLYRLVKLMFKKPEVKEHSGQGSKAKTERNRKHQQKRRLRVRELKLHGDEEHLQCATPCADEDLVIEEDDTTWYKFGKCNQKDAVYDPSFLSYIVEKQEDVDGDVYKAEVINLKNTHCSIKLSETDDFLVQENKFLGAYKFSEVRDGKEVPIIEIEMEIASNDYEEFYEHVMSKFKDKQICDWRAEVAVKITDEIVMLKIKVVCLTTSIQGAPGRFLNNHLKDLKKISEDLKGIKENTREDFSEVIENGQDEGVDLVKFLKINHQVFMSRVPLVELDNVDRTGRSTHGLGHRNYIIFNAHNYDVGDIVRFWRFQDKERKIFNVCKVITSDKVRDLGIAKIISKDELKEHLYNNHVFTPITKISSVKDQFRSLESKLAPEEQWFDMVNHQTCISFLPTSDGITKGYISYVPKRPYLIDSEHQTREYVEVTYLGVNSDFARKGDCGGVIVSCNDRKATRILGMHAGAQDAKWVGAILRREDLTIVEQHGYEDNWSKLIVSGAPTDLPQGPCVTFIGKYKGTTRPTNPASISKWKLTPWVDQFDMQLEPAPLDPEDPRIKVELPRNKNGRKSLLLDKNSKMCERLPLMDESILEICIKQITDEMALKIGPIHSVGEDLDKVIEIGLNGHRDNKHVTAIDDRKSCGEPWNRLNNCSLKSDFLDNKEGFLSLKQDTAGKCLEARLKKKLLAAKQGERMFSFYTSKLKDEVLKISKVESGGTRVFANVPIDKIICDAALFGNFKEAYCRNFIDLNHAIGVNPHGLGWKLIYQHLNKHPNCFDLDFGNFDKRLSETLIHGAFRVIRKVIQYRAPDDWDEARRILENESVNSYMIDFDTVYMTDRGNKSGEYLTTVINCICNDILSFYAWICTTGEEDLGVFRDNVNLITFGDDKCESVSDEYASKYNYFTVKEIMKLIGHEITPGNKDGIEREFCGLDQLQFLKRTFEEREDMVVAPLLQRSIESPFVWTQTPNSDFPVWANLVEASLFEACLHGQEYYENFLEKLKQCTDAELLKAISRKLVCSYEPIMKKYSQLWHNSKVHLDD